MRWFYISIRTVSRVSMSIFDDSLANLEAPFPAELDSLYGFQPLAPIWSNDERNDHGGFFSQTDSAPSVHFDGMMPLTPLSQPDQASDHCGPVHDTWSSLSLLDHELPPVARDESEPVEQDMWSSLLLLDHEEEKKSSGGGDGSQPTSDDIWSDDAPAAAPPVVKNSYWQEYRRSHPIFVDLTLMEDTDDEEPEEPKPKRPKKTDHPVLSAAKQREQDRRIASLVKSFMKAEKHKQRQEDTEEFLAVKKKLEEESAETRRLVLEALAGIRAYEKNLADKKKKKQGKSKRV